MVAREMDVTEVASTIVGTLLGVKPGEQVLLIADAETDTRMVNSLAAAAKSAGADSVIAIMSSRGRIEEGSHTKLPGMLKRALEEADVAIGLNRTSGAPSYDDTLARLLKERRIRYMSMVMRSIDNWTKGAATADYEEVYRTAEKLAELMRGERIRVTTRAGTDLEADTGGRRVIIEAGFATRPGDSAAFSDGEVSLTPIEGTAKGTVIVDGTIAYLGSPEEAVKLEVRGGRVISVRGGGEADKIKEWLRTVENFDNFAEIGIGVNPNARSIGDWQEEKKKLGTLHIALGDNIYYGGSVECPLHFDMVLYEPTVEVDGRTIVDGGRLKLK